MSFQMVVKIRPRLEPGADRQNSRENMLTEQGRNRETAGKDQARNRKLALRRIEAGVGAVSP
jgi:hypothetical protein